MKTWVLYFFLTAYPSEPVRVALSHDTLGACQGRAEETMKNKGLRLARFECRYEEISWVRR